MPKNPQISPEKALERLERLCVRAEHCTYELRQKLWKWNISPSESEAIIERLKRLRFVDDERFAAAYINDKIRFAKWGPRKIALALAQKRIDFNTVRSMLDEIDGDIIKQNLIDILNSRARTIAEPRTYDGRTRLFRYAVSRGYTSDLIAEVIRKHFV